MSSKGFVLIAEVIIFETISDLCPYTIVGFNEVMKVFNNLK